MSIEEAINTLRTLCAATQTSDWATRVQIHEAMTTTESTLASLGVKIPAAAIRSTAAEPAAPTAPPATTPGVATRSRPSPTPAGPVLPNGKRA